MPARPAAPAKPVHVVEHDYAAAQSDELTIKSGDRVEILEKIDANWWRAKHLGSGKEGLVPVSYLRA